jgi:hypothetical protein
MQVDLKDRPDFKGVFTALDDNFTAWPSVIFHERGIISFV